MKALYPLLLTFALFGSHNCYCPPLIAPKTTNLKCEDPVKHQRVNCSSSWLPEGTVAYFTCVPPDSTKRAIGRIRCSEDGIHRQDRGIGNYSSVDLPCGIIRDSNKPEIHVYGYQAPVHYNLTGKVDTDYRSLGENLHNKFRSMHGSEPLRLQANLSKLAQDWADNVSATGRLDMAGSLSFGQNIFLVPATDDNLTDAVNDAVQNWYYSGYSAYNWEDMTENWHNSLSLDFSQLVWKNSKFLGIGASKMKSGKGTAVIAFYDPAGNMVMDGDEESSERLFQLNVLPLQVNHAL